MQPSGGESGRRPGEVTAPLPVSRAGTPPAAADRWFPFPETGPPQAWGPPRRERGRWRRLLRGIVIVILSLVMVSVVGFAILLLITPSAGNAPALARARDRAQHVGYPGPPVPRRFAAALVATEDHRFYSEPGVDPFAIVRVIMAKLTGGGDQGGATLYQQLAKLLYTPGRSGLSVEAEQLALAVKLRYSYRGQQILRMYASVVYFGHGFYGLRAASCGYFGTEPTRLSWPQSALLAGLIQGPSADDPLTHPARARAREVHVIGRLVATGALTRGQARASLRLGVPKLVRNAGHGCGAPG